MKKKNDVAKIVKFLGSIEIVLLFLFLAACEDSVTDSTASDSAAAEKQLGMEVYASVKDLPECSKRNNGELAWVKKDNSTRVCVDGKWRETVVSTKDTVVLAPDTLVLSSDTVVLTPDTIFLSPDTVVLTPDTIFLSPDTIVLAPDTVYLKEKDFSCMTEELGDGSGLKVICNGDSIGVLLNGKKGSDGGPGEQGEPGVGCSVAGQTDSSVTIACGKDSTTILLKMPVKPEPYAEFSQKGFFQKGSSVYFYQLTDGRTLKDSGLVYSSEIINDDGRYKFGSRNLVSQYAKLEFEGFFRNVVTGKVSNAPIKLGAYTDVLSRRTASVNVFTYLELNRVFKLVTKEKMRVKTSKHQAQHEIMSLFYMDTTGMKTESEDFDLFGSGETDAMLLAATVLLQGDRSESEFKSLLTEISNAIIEEGEWNDSVKRMEIAAWARDADSTGRLDEIRENIVKNVNENMPDFRKYVRNYWCAEYGLENCEEVQ